jgi:hypothetical protein
MMIKASWGKTDAAASNSDDDRIELIDDTPEAREEFGKNYGAYEFRLTREQVEGVLAGKVVAFYINGREYSGFMSVKK